MVHTSVVIAVIVLGAASACGTLFLGWLEINVTISISSKQI